MNSSLLPQSEIYNTRPLEGTKAEKVMLICYKIAITVCSSHAGGTGERVSDSSLPEVTRTLAADVSFVYQGLLAKEATPLLISPGDVYVFDISFDIWMVMKGTLIY